MDSLRSMRAGSPLATLVLAAAACMLVVSIVIYPKQAFEASLQGLTIWWNIVFPGLLPFLILSELLIGFGMMHFWGVLLDPFMRAGFRLPGVSGLAVAMGATAGYAAAAQTTARLRERNQISRAEGDRLLALSYCTSPVVIIGVVATGFFGQPRLGWALLIVHFAAWLAVGLLLRAVPADRSAGRSSRLGTTEGGASPTGASPTVVSTTRTSNGTEAPFRTLQSSPPSSVRADRHGLRRAYAAMLQGRREDGRSLGKLLGDAVIQSIAALMMIGGYMLLFSVILEIGRMIGLYPALLQLVAGALPSMQQPLETAEALLAGLFELHLGTHASSRVPLSPAMQTALAGAVLAWGGFAAHAQVKSLIGDTDLSLRWFVPARLLHGLFAFVLTLVCWNPLLSRFTVESAAALPDAAGGAIVPGGETALPGSGWLAPSAGPLQGTVAGWWPLWLEGLLWGGFALLLFAGISALIRGRRAG